MLNNERMLRLFRILIGAAMILLGSLGVLLGIIEIVDPVGSKMADDNDPLGPPRSRAGSVLVTTVYAGIAVGGVFLTVWNPRKKNEVEPADA